MIFLETILRSIDRYNVMYDNLVKIIAVSYKYAQEYSDIKNIDGQQIAYIYTIIENNINLTNATTSLLLDYEKNVEDCYNCSIGCEDIDPELVKKITIDIPKECHCLINQSTSINSALTSILKTICDKIQEDEDKEP